MCDELGDYDYMVEYVEEAGQTSLCAIDGTGCDERAAAYMEKMKERSKEDQEAQLQRLEGMEGQNMKEDLKKWIRMRKRMLRALIDTYDEDEL